MTPLWTVTERTAARGIAMPQAEVAALLGLEGLPAPAARRAILRQVRTHGFPAPLRRGGGTWSRQAVEEWVAARSAPQPPPPAGTPEPPAVLRQRRALLASFQGA